MADETITLSVQQAKRRRAYENWRIKNPKLPPREPIVSANGRLCRTCGVRKFNDQFRTDKRSRDGLAWRCRDCAREAHKRWVAANRDRVRDAARGTQRRSYAANPDKAREILRRSRLRTKYGIELEDLVRMLDAQGWLCKVCDKQLAMRTFDLRKSNVACVDHDHGTGKIRGILCSHCNRAIGLFGDSIAKLERAVSYLRG